MTEELELGAVPAEDAGYGDAVSDAEFAEWVRRSQADTDAAIAEWDAGVQFDMRIEPDPPPIDIEGEPLDADDVHTEGTFYPWQREVLRQVYEGRAVFAVPRRNGRSSFVDAVLIAETAEAARREQYQEAMLSDLAITCARRNLEAAGFQIMDVTDEMVTLPRRALVPEMHRRGYFVADRDVQAASSEREETSTRTGLILPSRSTAPELRFSIVSEEWLTQSLGRRHASFTAISG